MPLFIPPLLAVTLGAVGVVALARVAVRHSRRVNDRLDAMRAAARAEQAPDGPKFKLRRDPETGDYRPD
ncbi:MAG: hypothetical protein JWN71_798 [Xanthobacteraceae bacterium]|jgi:hypothetical protein|nr:hypothetical protein [Xanthobacteraceae bacterium]